MVTFNASNTSVEKAYLDPNFLLLFLFSEKGVDGGKGKQPFQKRKTTSDLDHSEHHLS